MNYNDRLLAQIEGALAQIDLPSEPERLYAPISYSLSGGGKRLRPMLAALSCELFAGSPQVAMPAAIALEIFHNFTLLHDDIMDNAKIRRGKPSVYAKWDQNVAILSGDVMMISAYKELARLPHELLPAVFDLFNTMAAEVCEGQQYDMDYETKPKVSVVEYMRMIELKTSVLLGAAAEIGALLGGASPEQCKTMRRFATELGLAFQLQDDLLDTYGTEAELGKSIGGDILEGKQTYLMTASMSRADEPTREILRNTYKDESLSNSEKIATIKEVYHQLDILKITQQQIATRFERALSLLSSLDVEDDKLDNLRTFAQGLMNRRS